MISRKVLALLSLLALAAAAHADDLVAGFHPTAFGTPITATTAGATGTLPAGLTVVVQNVGANGAYCQLGGSATTSAPYIAPDGGWFAFSPSSETQLTCVTAASTTTVNMVGGAGLPTGTAGTAGISGQSDPCFAAAKTNLPISTNSTALAQIIGASASTKIYICSVSLIAAGATAFNFNTGTGTNCGTSTAAVLGSTTAANGLSFAANGGLTLGNGNGTIAIANVAGAELCTLQSNAVYVSGNLTYVQQ